jgi:hypothetical protein
MAETKEEQVARHVKGIAAFRALVEGLPPDLFLEPMHGWWSARDVTAHIVGWHQLMLDSYETMRRGELPAYFDDPGDDWSKVNATLVRQYPSTDRSTLLGELVRLAGEIRAYIEAAEPQDWDPSECARIGKYRVTIRTSLEALIDELREHGQQIADWAAGQEKAGAKETSP